MVNINVIDFFSTLGFDGGICKLEEIVCSFRNEHKSVSKDENQLQSNDIISVKQDPKNKI